MNSISPDVAKKFCELCQSTYDCWAMHEQLSNKLNQAGNTITTAQFFINRLSKISQEYTLLQICKLHDPAIQKKSLNITIDYIVRFGDWEPDKEEIEKIVKLLNTLFEKIKPARHKVIAHNDLETLMGEETNLGVFPDGLDDEYFEALQELVSMVQKKWPIGQPPFLSFAESSFAVADADEFVNALKRASEAP